MAKVKRATARDRCANCGLAHGKQVFLHPVTQDGIDRLLCGGCRMVLLRGDGPEAHGFKGIRVLDHVPPSGRARFVPDGHSHEITTLPIDHVAARRARQ